MYKESDEHLGSIGSLNCEYKMDEYDKQLKFSKQSQHLVGTNNIPIPDITQMNE